LKNLYKLKFMVGQNLLTFFLLIQGDCSINFSAYSQFQKNVYRKLRFDRNLLTKNVCLKLRSDRLNNLKSLLSNYADRNGSLAKHVTNNSEGAVLFVQKKF
jgi:hypothetical protein